MNKRSLTLLFIVVFMDMVGFGFIIPILPDFISRIGASQNLLGMVLGIYALGQFIAAPIVGSLSDRFGRKPLLLLSIGGTFLSLIVLGVARSIPLIIASRLLDGLTGGNITVAQSYIADSTSDEERAKGLGLIGMAFGLGFVLGPLFGGLLVNISLSAPAFIAAGIAAVNLLVIAFILPESLPAEQRERHSSVSLFDTQTFKRMFNQLEVRRLMGIIFTYTLAFNMFETMFSSHSMLAVNLTPQSRGVVLAYVGILIAVVQGGLVGRLSSRFSGRFLLRSASLLLVVSLVAWAFATNIAMLLIAVTPLSLAAAVQSVVQKSALSLSVDASSQGAALGVSASLESINRIIAPVAGGFLLSKVALWAPGVVSAVIILVPLFLAFTIPKDAPAAEHMPAN